jgi:hypothetical protein
MPAFIVYRKSDSVEMTRYAAASTAPMEDRYPLAEYDHMEIVPDAPDPVPVDPESRLLTKLEYLRLFTQEERIAIKTVAKSNVVLEDYLYMLELAQEISLDDPDTIAAVNMLEAAGLLAAGRAAEVLS